MTAPSDTSGPDGIAQNLRLGVSALFAMAAGWLLRRAGQQPRPSGRTPPSDDLQSVVDALNRAMHELSAIRVQMQGMAAAIEHIDGRLTALEAKVRFAGHHMDFGGGLEKGT